MDVCEGKVNYYMYIYVCEIEIFFMFYLFLENVDMSCVIDDLLILLIDVDFILILW